MEETDSQKEVMKNYQYFKSSEYQLDLLPLYMTKLGIPLFLLVEVVLPTEGTLEKMVPTLLYGFVIPGALSYFHRGLKIKRYEQKYPFLLEGKISSIDPGEKEILLDQVQIAELNLEKKEGNKDDYETKRML